MIVRGARLEHAWIGAPAKEALVFLHEGLGSVSLWRDFPALVSEACGVSALVYSRAGYGKSEPTPLPWTARYMHDEALSVLPEVLDAARVERAHLIGHSDGGSIAIIFAGAHVARVASLALIAPHVFVEDVSVASIARAAEEYTRGDLRARLARHHDHVDVAFWGWNRAWLAPEFRGWNIEEYVPKIKARTLVIQGEDDPYGTLAQLEAIERQIGAPCARLVIPRCGHAPHRERSDACVRAIAAHLAF